MTFQWTPDRLTILRGLWEQDFTGSQIADRLFSETQERVTRSAVLGRAMRLGLKKPKREAAPKPIEKAAAAAPKPPMPKPRFIDNLGAEATRAPYVKITLPVVKALLPKEPEKPVHVTGLNPGLCRWPLWRADDLPPSQKMFCGASAGTRSYCPRHQQMAYSGLGRRS